MNDPFVTPGQGLASVAAFGYGGIHVGAGGDWAGDSALAGILVGFGLILVCSLYQLLFSWSLRRLVIQCEASRWIA